MTTRQKLLRQGYSNKVIKEYLECETTFKASKDRDVKTAMVRKMQELLSDERVRIGHLSWMGR